MELAMEVKFKKSVFKEVEKLPKNVQLLYKKFIIELQSEGVYK
jgi:mRNA-degrading endonuclease RelE of RelBE toxin-antitoxin system